MTIFTLTEWKRKDRCESSQEKARILVKLWVRWQIGAVRTGGDEEKKKKWEERVSGTLFLFFSAPLFNP